jgi:hypothetical protein
MIMLRLGRTMSGDEIDTLVRHFKVCEIGYEIDLGSWLG